MIKALEVKNLSKTYKNQRGLKNISFEVHSGDIYGFLGPNGAGKSTVMKAITGLLRPDKGEIRIFGHSTYDEFENAMQHVGSIIETADAYEYMSASQNLKMAARFYPQITKSRISEVLELVGLNEVQDEKVRQFSLGMKQRLGIASAILSEPSLLILDEPTNGLDIEGTVIIRKILMQLAREEGTAIFVSSHLAHEMELMCNRVGIIDQGKLITEGAVSDVLQTHASLEAFFIHQTTKDRREGLNEQDIF